MSPATLHIGSAPTAAESAKIKKPAQAAPKRRQKSGNIIGQMNNYFAKFTPIKDDDKVSFFD